MIWGWTPALLSLAKLRDRLTRLVMTNCFQGCYVIRALNFVLCASIFPFPNGIAPVKVPSSKFKAQRSNLSSLKVFNYFSRGIRSRPTRDATTRMRAGATKIKPLDWSSILRPTDQGAKREKLIERLFAVMNMPATHSVSLFQIERCDHLPCNNQFLQIRSITAQNINYIVGKLFTSGVPIALFQFVSHILNVN